MTDCRGRAQTRIFIHFFKNFTLDNQENLESLNSETTGTTETVETVKKAPETVLTAHDDFDWNVDKRNKITYSKDESSKLELTYEGTFKTLNDNEIINATIVGLTDTDVILNVGYKSDGLVSKTEFRDIEDLKVGMDVEVYVVSKEDGKGQLNLSRKSAKMMKAWEHIVDAYKNEVIVTGNIISKTKGGLIVEVFGIETFLPGSQIDVKPITDYDGYVGKKMEFKVVKINETIKNAVVSHKALIESDIETQRQEIIGKLEKGQVLEGTIKNITDFGAFIDLGGVDGLLYITDISWGRINHPNEVLHMNQKLNVVVLDFDDNKKRISLGLKQLTPHPWEVLDAAIQVGSVVKGKIVNIEDYGAFLEILPGVEGLIHVSEITWSNQPINSKEYFTVNQEFEAKVVTLDREERKMSLSVKQLSEDPWKSAKDKYPINSKHSGLVKNITNYGVFVELDENVGGMVHISDLSWIKRLNHPSEFVKIGERLDVIILEIDEENRKISLGHKQIEEDPWDTFENVFPIGSMHEGTIIRKDEKGAVVSLPYGLEGYAPNKHLEKADGSTAHAEEMLTFKVIEFDRNDKRILVSHTKFVKDNTDEEKREQVKTRQRDDKKSKSQLTKVQKNVVKTALGELDAFSVKRTNGKDSKGSAKASKKAEEKSEDVSDASTEETTDDNEA
ncbi:MAG: 30S ribosomal protein S1 [Bacteroidetes bacterium]|nr:30S ribosomal protein S1 [Bacteroidota bacterium]